MMRPGAVVFAAFLVSFVLAGWIGGGRIAKGQQDAPKLRAGLVPSYGPQIDNIMDLLGKGKIDDALMAIDFYKNHPDAKQVMRDRLVAFYAEQHRYFGYDVVAVQRFSGRLQSVSVVANYDEQPLLFHFDFYHPEAGGNQPWIIPGFGMHENVVEELKDVPVDYHPTAR